MGKMINCKKTDKCASKYDNFMFLTILQKNYTMYTF